MSETNERLMEKIAKLLALAERTDNEHEADAFLRQAQVMATRHAIDLAVARSHQTRKQQRATPIQRRRTIGVQGAMGNTRLIQLYSAICSANDVVLNIARNNTYVIAFGFPSDIDLVDALHVHLSAQMVGAGNAYLRSGEHLDEAVWDPRTNRWKPMNPRTARLSFYDGWIARVRKRLAEAAEAAKQEEITSRDAAEGSGSTALVLADKVAEVEQFHRATSQARGSWRGSRVNQWSESAARAGDRAGRRASLAPHREVDGGHTAIG